MKQIILELDPKSQAILQYLISNRHGSIHELTSAAGLPSHMETLRRIRNVINPLARRSIGKDLLMLKRVYVDPVTGDMVTYHWWLEASLGSAVSARESDREIVVSVSAPDNISLDGKAEVWVSKRNALIRIFKGGFSSGHQD